MAKQMDSRIPAGIIYILSGLFCILYLSEGFANPQKQQLTRDEFSDDLIKAYRYDNEQLATSLITGNRLFVKSVVNDLIKESLVKELSGKSGESEQAFQIAEKTAGIFADIFGEKSLLTAVNYLKSWSKEQKRNKLVADSLYFLGTSIRDNDRDMDQAVAYYQEALRLYKDIGDERGEAEILGGLGLIFSKSDLQKSMSYYVQALEIREKVDDRQLTGNSLNSIAVVYRNSGDFSQAIPYFDRAEMIRAEIGDLSNLRRTQSLKADTYLSLAEEQNNSGRYTESLQNLEKAMEIEKNLNSKAGEGKVLNQMGFVYSNLGDYGTAIEKISVAVKIMEEENDTSGLAGAYNHLGIVLQMSGRLEKALEYFNRSLMIFEELSDQENVVALLSNLGTLSFDTKDYIKAEEYHLRALQISREIKHRRYEVNCLLNLANDQSLLGKSAEAVSCYESGLEIARSFNSPDLMWKFFVGLADNYQRHGEYDKAVELNDSALHIIDRIRNTIDDEELKASYLARERFAFEGVISMLGILHEENSTKGYDILAFEYAEQSKSRALLELLAESLAKINRGADSELIQKQEVILADLTHLKQLLEQESLKDQPDKEIVINLQKKINGAQEEFDTLKVEIRNTNPKYADLKYPRPVTLEEVQALCPDKNTVILEYSVGDSSSSLWLITSSDHRLFRIPGRKTLQDQTEALRFALLDPMNSDKEFITSAGYSLYLKLLKPVEPYLTGKSKLVIIPDGILNYLPYEVLLTENKGVGKNTPFSDLPFLIKKYPVSYVQSASVLKSLISGNAGEKLTAPASKSIIAFGDPVYEIVNDSSWSSVKSYSRLEYSGKEVEMIASYFKKGSADIFLRGDATEANVKRNGEMKKFNYIHFATHGLIDEKNPDLSSLVLSQNNNTVEDGFLRAAEIFNLELNADLVVLSACQTGLGKLLRGEGMVGLSRAFMYAGTPAVMVSLWSVSDISTATLMGEFYKNLLKKDLYKTDALRKAQLTMLKDKKYAHPFYWAPFVLFGEWR